MASSMDSDRDQEVPDGEEPDVKAVQAHYLRSPSPSRFSVLSDAETESIFMEPIHLSSAVAAKQIIKEELKTKEVKVDTVCPGMLESAEQLLMEDLYNRVKEKIDDTSLFNTPCVMDIQRALMKDYLESPREVIDEVWPNIFIGEKSAAVNKGRLKRLGITHILNAAHGTGVYTGPDFYNGMNIQYLGIEVDDFPDEEIAKHFRPAAEFLDEALLTCRGKVLVCSEMGVSRSAVLVSAYLMIFHHMTILEALLTIRKKRAIYPNDGFLKQLRELNEKLLEEREEEEDSEDTTDDQSSVVRAGSCSSLSETEDSRSIVGAKVHSIMVEEEDTTSLLGSAMSASSMGKLSLFSKEPTLISEEEEEELYEEWRRKQGLPDKEILKKKEESKASDLSLQGQVESEENVDQMIQAWQCQNEKYQMENYMFSKEEEASMGQKSCLVNDTTDTESVSSQEIRILKQELEASSINRMRRGRTDSMSTESSWDMWNERMMEIEKEASKKYCSKARYSDENLKSENGTRERDIDTESVLSDASSFYNFCQKNKDKLTALERWKIKRIQFGFHKKDSEVEQSKAGDSSQQNKESMEEEKSLSDINMTAYQAWKTKHQKKVGSENKDDIVELTKGEDSTCARRKQRRMELLEHSKKLLEESQSLCSWEAETSMSGSIPLSAFWPSTASVNGVEDSASAISMQTNRSTFSQARSSHGAKSASVPGPSIGPDETISIASIQNWIANVVNETIAQKQNEILMLSRSPSVLSSSVKSGDPNRHGENDRSSLLKAQIGLPLSSSTSLLHQDPQYADTQSILSCNTSVSMGDSVSTRKVTQTSKPLFSLFADEVDLKKLSRKEREMQTEMREKMSDYQMEKLISDNKRSTLFKKKKIKGDDEDEKRENLYDRSIENVNGGPRHSLTDDNNSSDTALSGQFANVGGVIRSEVENNVNKWLIGLKAEKPSYQDCTEASSEKYRNSSTFRKVNTEASSYRSSRSQREEMNSSATHQYKNKLQRTSSQFSSASAQEEKAYTFTESKVSEINSTEESPEPCSSRTPKSSYSSESSKPSTRLYHLEEHEEESRLDMTESGAKRKFTQSFAKSEEGTEKEENMEESKEYISSKYLIRNRQSTRKEEEEMDDDAIIAAWRSRQAETKAKLQRRREE